MAGRDLWRLVDRFDHHAHISKWDSFGLLKRLLQEQYETTTKPGKVDSSEVDADLAPVPVKVKEAKQVGSDSLQSPHDADATYGHKGKGYEVQVAETYGNKIEHEDQGKQTDSPQDQADDARSADVVKPEMITYVALTNSCGSDAALPASCRRMRCRCWSEPWARRWARPQTEATRVFAASASVASVRSARSRTRSGSASRRMRL